MISALITGALFRSAESRTSKSGKQFVTATVRIKDGDGSQFVRLVAFSESAQAELLRLQDGDCFSAQGQFKAEIYAKDGNSHCRLSPIKFSPLGSHRKSARPKRQNCRQMTRDRGKRGAQARGLPAAVQATTFRSVTRDDQLFRR
jgi:hypothetical protein